LRIELHRAGKRSVIDVQTDRALIGSGAHCDVRLLPDEAAVEQLLVQVLGDGEVYAQVRAFDPVCLLNGAPFLEGRLMPTSLLELGGVVLGVQQSTVKEAKDPRRSGQASTSPVVQALGVLGVILGLYVVLSQPGAAVSVVGETVTPPTLGEVVSTPCAQRQPLAAAALAEQLWLQADTMRERSPFYSGDGLSAIGLFARAAGCFEAAGAAERAGEAKQAALTLRAHMSDELHLRHVRLERFIGQVQYDKARREAQLLGELVSDKSGPYAAWLSSVRREGELRSNAGRAP
jgi:hypothetical protein